MPFFSAPVADVSGALELGRRALVSLAAWLLLLALLVALFAPDVAAQERVLRRPALHWVRGEGAAACVDPRTLAAGVEELVGPVLVRPSEAEHTLEGYAQRARAGWQVRIRLVDAGGAQIGERVLERAAGGCAALTPEIAFVLAMMIDPGVMAHGLPPELVALLGGSAAPERALLDELEQGPAQAPGARAAAPQSARRGPKRRAPPRPQPERPLRGQAALLMRGALREAPRVTLAAELRLLYALLGPLAAAGYLRAGGQLGAHEFQAERAIRSAVFDLGLVLCGGHPSARALRLHGCMGGELTLLLAAGDGFSAEKKGVLVAAGLVALLTARVRLRGAFGLLAALSARLSQERRQLLYRDADAEIVAYRYPRVSFGAALGPSFEF